MPIPTYGCLIMTGRNFFFSNKCHAIYLFKIYCAWDELVIYLKNEKIESFFSSLHSVKHISTLNWGRVAGGGQFLENLSCMPNF